MSPRRRPGRRGRRPYVVRNRGPARGSRVDHAGHHVHRRNAVHRRTARDGGPRTEASGNVTSSTVSSVAETGVDAISVGGITHSAPAFDLSLLLTPTTLAGESPRAAADGRPAQRFG
ncbi:hypothetical protein ACIGT4_33990 [Streptomyces sioyaensis]|uniref:hypothetical protein n=1 Tax=Streptomyces sioyaensis TaxID=67364 RepID=UPI0037D5844F